MRKNYSAEEKQAIIDKYRSGVVVTEIAKSTGVIEHRTSMKPIISVNNGVLQNKNDTIIFSNFLRILLTLGRSTDIIYSVMQEERRRLL